VSGDKAAVSGRSRLPEGKARGARCWCGVRAVPLRADAPRPMRWRGACEDRHERRVRWSRMCSHADQRSGEIVNRSCTSDRT